jgi:hypothetical protein
MPKTPSASCGLAISVVRTANACFFSYEVFLQPKLRRLGWFHRADLGFYGLAVMAGGYVRVGVWARRAVFHRLEQRVRARVLICMLTCYLTWHLRRAWAPVHLGPAHPGPLRRPGRRSAAAQAEASYPHDPAGQPYRSFRDILEHLVTLTRYQVRYNGPRSPSRCSPSRPAPGGRPSSSSAVRSRSPARSQNTTRPIRQRD